MNSDHPNMGCSVCSRYRPMAVIIEETSKFIPFRYHKCNKNTNSLLFCSQCLFLGVRYVPELLELPNCSSIITHNCLEGCIWDNRLYCISQNLSFFLFRHSFKANWRFLGTWAWQWNFRIYSFSQAKLNFELSRVNSTWYSWQKIRMKLDIINNVAQAGFDWTSLT